MKNRLTSMIQYMLMNAKFNPYDVTLEDVEVYVHIRRNVRKMTRTRNRIGYDTLMVKRSCIG